MVLTQDGAAGTRDKGTEGPEGGGRGTGCRCLRTASPPPRFNPSNPFLFRIPPFAPAQKESETLQQKVVHENLEMDDFLAKELETQNTCPICYDLMVCDMTAVCVG